GYFVSSITKGERSCPLPLGMAVAIPHPLLRFGANCALRARGDFAACGRRPGALPRGPRSLERLANFLVAASPRVTLSFCSALNNNLHYVLKFRAVRVILIL
ncbi:MAG: hypothetical protein NC395_08830, partial [Prevotella sp.]|nr:hypothetical protein [Prevotella sp.]